MIPPDCSPSRKRGNLADLNGAAEEPVTGSRAHDGKGAAMRKYCLTTMSVLSLVVFAGSNRASAQSADLTQQIMHIANTYQFVSNVVYRRSSNWEAKLDIYQPRGLTAPNPTVMFFHGGGWTNGDKEGAVFGLLPWVEMGWSVVNVEYRLTDVALAPAAVEDARCALRWVYRNARQYNFDVKRH